MNSDYPRFKMEFCRIVNSLCDGSNAPIIEDDSLMLNDREDRCMAVDIEGFFSKWYNDGNLTIDDVAAEAADIVKSVSVPYNELDLNDYSSVKEHLMLKVVPNKNDESHDDEMFVEFPNLEGIAISAEIVLRDTYYGCCTTPVKDEMLQEWGVSETDLFKTAFANAKDNDELIFMSLKDYIKAFEETLPVACPKDVYIALSRSGQDSISVLAVPTFFSDAAERMNGNYYVFPSSKNEVLLIPERLGPAERIDKLLKDNNNQMVLAGEVISNLCFHYDAQSETIEYGKDFDKRQRIKKGREER